MERDDIRRVQRTWQLAMDRQINVTQAFYEQLFQIVPSAQLLFEGDLEVQHQKFAMAFGYMVKNMERPGRLTPAAPDLAARHDAYGVTSEHYDALGEAIVLAFQKELGEEFEAADAAAWRACYTAILAAMSTPEDAPS